MTKARNPNPTRKKQSKPLRGHFRSQFIKHLDRILNPKNPYKPEKPARGGRPAPSQVPDYQPAEGTQDLAKSSSAIAKDKFSSPRLGQTRWIEAPRSPPVDSQLPSLPAHDSFITDSSLLVWEFIEDHAQGPAPGPSFNMYSDNLDDYGSQPYHSTQGTSDVDFEALERFHYANSPPAEVWGGQDQHATDPYFTQAPTASAQQTWEQQPDPQLDLTSIQCQSVKIWGPNQCWTYLNAVVDQTSQHSYLRSSAANKAGWYGFTPVAPGHNRQSSTQYGLVTPTQYVNAFIAADGFFGFPQRNDDIYIFPDGQYCPANVELIIGRNLWQTVYREAEASALASDQFSYCC